MDKHFTYQGLDEAKIAGLSAAGKTDGNIADTGYLLFKKTRGESALVVAAPDHYLALVEEGLGTKNLVAEKTGSPLDHAAWDTVAMIVNDLVTSGARPLVVNAHWAVGANSYLTPERAQALALGWSRACTEAGAIYGAGETPCLEGIISPETIALSGSGVGIIKPKSLLVTEDNLKSGDHIILVSSSGIHANGLTDARKVAAQLPRGYRTLLADGRTFGTALLTPTVIYARLVKAVQEAGIRISYLSNITGHGWRKLMRPQTAFTYRLHTVTPVLPEFTLIAKTGGFSPREMYGRFNMGAGFAVYVREADCTKTLRVIGKSGYRAFDAGVVESGPKSVVIEPENIVFTEESLQIR